MAEKLGRRIRHRERVAAQSANTRELRHEHYHGFLKLRAAPLRALIVRLMLGSVDALRESAQNPKHHRPKPVGERCDPITSTFSQLKFSGFCLNTEWGCWLPTSMAVHNTAQGQVTFRAMPST
jgi:hypothetical protein